MLVVQARQAAGAMKRWMALALALAALAAAPLRAAAQTQVAWLPAQMRQFQDQPYVNTTQVPSSECAGIWQGALDAGNCSTTACTPTCLQSLAQVRAAGTACKPAAHRLRSCSKRQHALAPRGVMEPCLHLH